jgi:glycosyltransferase involved in cell wall biosynthesis
MSQKNLAKFRGIEENPSGEGLLSGLTILRFAHAFSRGAGVEQYLDDLDTTLLYRNNVTIIRMYLAVPDDNATNTVEKIGKGILVKRPLFVDNSAKESTTQINLKKNPVKLFIKDFIRDWFLFNPILYSCFFRRSIKKRSVLEKSVEVINIAESARSILSEYKVNLLVLHHLGGRDSSELISEVKKNNIPFVFQNHFTNKRFNDLSIREQMTSASGIAGVSMVDLPKRLKNKFVNLSDGIDTDIFSTEVARALDFQSEVPAIILPARFSPVKGQDILIEVAYRLKEKGLRVKVILAGRNDSIKYFEQLKQQAKHYDLLKDVLFVGDLTKEQLRDWYNVSSALVFPVRDLEGLPRILLEAQAMKVPPISYISGGTQAGIIHGKTGLLVPRGDIKGLVDSLFELLSNEQKRKEMAENGRRFILQNHSLKELARRHESFYLKNVSR